MDALLMMLVTGLGAAVAMQIIKLVPFIKGLGEYGKQGVVLLIAVVIAIFQFGFSLLSAETLATIGTIWGLAVGWHQIIIGKFEKKNE